VPKDRIEALRSAYASVLKDAEFLKETEKSGMVIRSQPGAELEKSVKEVAQTPQPVIARTAQILKWK
jgi:tripartite-type tricarboxylate transporter receptor subunit TctC